MEEWWCIRRPLHPHKYFPCDRDFLHGFWGSNFAGEDASTVVFVAVVVDPWIGLKLYSVRIASPSPSSSPARLFSHDIISENTTSTLASGSPEVKPCHIPWYSFIVLSLLLARSYNALLTSGSVTVSASPCNTKNGRVTWEGFLNFSQYFIISLLIWLIKFEIARKTFWIG